MSTTTNDFKFKGDAFENRYRFEGELLAKTPTHVGTGGERKEVRTESKEPDVAPETQGIALIARDFHDRPYLPGSSLRGVVRHYLLQIFRSFGRRIAQDPDYETEDSPILDQKGRKIKFRELEQEQQKTYMRDHASLLEQLFGTPFAEGKIEFWDAPAVNTVAATNDADKEKGWQQERQSYVVRSVAINPLTGAAEGGKLYAFEVAPPGLRYHVNLVGQNLSDVELGFLLFGLFGFNSEIFPLTVGAMSGRGFGQMQFELKNLYRVKRDELGNWVNMAGAGNHAGYSALPKVNLPVNQLIKPFKDAFHQKMKEVL